MLLSLFSTEFNKLFDRLSTDNINVIQPFHHISVSKQFFINKLTNFKKILCLFKFLIGAFHKNEQIMGDDVESGEVARQSPEQQRMSLVSFILSKFVVATCIVVIFFILFNCDAVSALLYTRMYSVFCAVLMLASLIVMGINSIPCIITKRLKEGIEF
jgi:hypothetical protein